jgi:endonuclease-3 related protein
LSSLAQESAFLLDVFARIEGRYDLDRWHWRSDTPALDICVGAILVQHTAWTNVEKALLNLRAAGRLSETGIADLSLQEVAGLIRPAGMPLQKAGRLQAFVSSARSRGGLQALLSLPPAELRAVLLRTPGIGPETADVIVLYAAGGLAKVHDAYTQRLFRRLGVGPDRDGYDTWASWMAERLPPEVRLYQRFHAGIVVHCKETCRSLPKCGRCPLLEICAFGKGAAGNFG